MMTSVALDLTIGAMASARGRQAFSNIDDNEKDDRLTREYDQRIPDENVDQSTMTRDIDAEESVATSSAENDIGGEKNAPLHSASFHRKPKTGWKFYALRRFCIRYIMFICSTCIANISRN